MGRNTPFRAERVDLGRNRPIRPDLGRGDQFVPKYTDQLRSGPKVSIWDEIQQLDPIWAEIHPSDPIWAEVIDLGRNRPDLGRGDRLRPKYTDQTQSGPKESNWAEIDLSNPISAERIDLDRKKKRTGPKESIWAEIDPI